MVVGASWATWTLPGLNCRQIATEQVNNILVRDRKRVSAYYPFLWVWHRLDKDRWHYSSIPMRTGRKKRGKLEVDHTIADAWWGRLVDEEIATKLVDFEGTDEERELVAPDDFGSPIDARSFINLLGNCSLLDKSFNISKSDSPMWKFLEDVHEFKEGKIERSVESALLLSENLTEPNGHSLGDLRKLLMTRDAAIRKDLSEFITGSRRGSTHSSNPRKLRRETPLRFLPDSFPPGTDLRSSAARQESSAPFLLLPWRSPARS